MSAKSRLLLSLVALFLGLNVYFLKDFHEVYGPGANFWEGIDATAGAATAAVDASDNGRGAEFEEFMIKQKEINDNTQIRLDNLAYSMAEILNRFGTNSDKDSAINAGTHNPRPRADPKAPRKIIHVGDERKAEGQQNTTCLERRRQHNRTLLHIRPDRRGGFPETQFTHYLRTGIIDRFNATPRDELCHHGTFYIRQNSSASDVVVDTLNGGSTEVKRILIERVFSKGCGRRLPIPPGGAAPTVAVFGQVGGDFADPDSHLFQCFSKGSTAGGIFSLYNFQHVRAMIKHPHETDNQFVAHAVPWKDRGTIPIWRGALRGCEDYVARVVESGENRTAPELLDRFYVIDTQTDRKPENRVALVQFSLRHPELLDAAGEASPNLQKKITQKLNRTVEEFFPPPDRIPKEEYYSKYQVYVVMGGIGAAFRTADHLAMGSAVIVQDFPYEEWFLSSMRPGVHYIPLKADLSDLDKVLRWVRDNPHRVRRIAANGRLFYERYLSYERVEEFLYELVYRLAEARIYEGIGLNLLPELLTRP